VQARRLSIDQHSTLQKGAVCVWGGGVTTNRGTPKHKWREASTKPSSVKCRYRLPSTGCIHCLRTGLACTCAPPLGVHLQPHHLLLITSRCCCSAAAGTCCIRRLTRPLAFDAACRLEPAGACCGCTAARTCPYRIKRICYFDYGFKFGISHWAALQASGCCHLSRTVTRSCRRCRSRCQV
jgi:hypothetical protein